MLKQRIITALVLIPLTLLILFFSSSSLFLLLTALLMLGGAWEWSGLMQLHTLALRFAYLLVTIIVMIAVMLVPADVLFIFASLWWVFATVLIVLYPRARAYWSHLLVKGVMGWLVLIPCWAALNSIRGQQGGVYALLCLLVLIWGADSAAYFTGKKWGKHKLAPQVSPGKSVQGLAGALVFTLLLTLLLLWQLGTPFALWPWGLALALVTVLFSVIGDLFESMLKREAGLKDSGNLLPGHGGLLDRIDSLTAAAPVFAYCAWLLSTYLD